MDFSLTTEERDVQMWVREFVDREVRPLDEQALRNERAGAPGVIERWYHELRLARIYDGTDEIQRRTIARNPLKGHVTTGEM